MNLSKDKVDSIKCPLRPLKNEFLCSEVKCFLKALLRQFTSQKDIFQNVKYN